MLLESPIQISSRTFEEIVPGLFSMMESLALYIVVIVVKNGEVFCFGKYQS